MPEYYNRMDFEFGYSGNGSNMQQKEKGELFQLGGGVLDETLKKINYIIKVGQGRAAKAEQRTCDACHKTFASESFYTIHLSGRQHPQSPNYQPGSRTEGEKPTPHVAELLTETPGAGKGVPTY